MTAFVAGAVLADPRRGALAGLVALIVALAWYYGRWIGARSGFPIAFALAWLGLVGAHRPGSRSAGRRLGRPLGSVANDLCRAARGGASRRGGASAHPAGGLGRDSTLRARTAQLSLANLALAGVLVVVLLDRRRWAGAIAGAAAVAALGLGALVGVDLLFRLLADISMGA